MQAYIAGMPGWKRDLGKRLDALIVRNVPNVRKAVKWSSPLYGFADRVDLHDRRRAERGQGGAKTATNGTSCWAMDSPRRLSPP